MQFSRERAEENYGERERESEGESARKNEMGAHGSSARVQTLQTRSLPQKRKKKEMGAEQPKTTNKASRHEPSRAEPNWERASAFVFSSL